jgi:hypothetical protein
MRYLRPGEAVGEHSNYLALSWRQILAAELGFAAPASEAGARNVRDLALLITLQQA